jgi:hypothetical protein
MAEWEKPLFNRYDPYVIKGKLDEFISHELNNTHKFSQFFQLSNQKLALGFIATFFTLIAHIYGYIFASPFPKDYNITVICVIGYFIFNYSYQLFESYYEKETFYQCKPNLPGIKTIDFASTIEKFDHFYKIRAYVYTDKGEMKFVEVKKSVANFFSEDGWIVKGNVQKFIQEVLAEVKKKFN